MLLHAANATQILLVFHRLTGNLLPACCGTPPFAFQTVRDSLLAWVASRDSSLSPLFLLIASLFYLSARKPPSEPPTSSIRRLLPGWSLHAASDAAFLLALLSHEGAAGFPVVLAAMEVVAPPRHSSWNERIRQAAWRTAPYFLLLIFYIGGRLVLAGGASAGLLLPE